jgi:hypothetical protein
LLFELVVEKEPTAIQAVELVHDIPKNSPAGMVGLGLMDQVLPSQVSIKPVVLPPLPTATQSLAAGHETPVNAAVLLALVLTLGLGTTDQVVPFQDSTRGFCALEVVALL